MIVLMRPEHATAVARVHEAVLTDSAYTWIGRRFLEYYYRNLLDNEYFACHVHLFQGQVTGFLASTSASASVFSRQMRRDFPRIAAVLAGTVLEEPRKLAVILSAARFLFTQRRDLAPAAQGEVLSFAVLPEYRAMTRDAAGRRVPTEFYRQHGINVATDLFHATMQHLHDGRVRDLKIMTPSDNGASNRFYTKVGCQLVATAIPIFGHPTNLYYAEIGRLVASAQTGAAS